MIILALDTCLNACSAAVLDGREVLAWRSEVMARGHQERLAPLVREVMAEAGLPFGRLERIGATVGPGSFTGLRVGIAFAKGLASALSVPAVGVGVLEALTEGFADLVAGLIDARRDQVYMQVFNGAAPLMAPDVLSAAAAAARLADFATGRPLTLVGSGAPLLSGAFPAAEARIPEGCDPRAVARLAAARPADPIRPLYLRAPDAKLPA
jgi:tRNA threonylcarbamoyladenosine biosynthesis protein TsaB